MDKAALLYNEKLFRSWLINSYTTSPVGPRENVGSVYCIAYNVQRVFKPGARTFSDFKDDASESGKFYEELYQFFWASVHRTWLMVSGGNGGKRRRGNGGGPADPPRAGGAPAAGGAGDGVADDSGLEPFERSTSESTDQPARGRPPGASSWNEEPAMEVYMEAVMPEGADGEDGADDGSVGAERACAYRFWVLLRSGVTLDESMPMILEENAEMCKGGAGPGNKRRKGAQEAMACSAFERYRKIRKKSDLGVLADLYMDMQYMQRNMDAVNDPETPLTSAKNPLCARHLFAPASAFLHCGAGASARQGPASLGSYIEVRGRSARVKFPMPRYVMRLYPDQCTVEAISSKYLPHYQQTCVHPIARVYPEFFPRGPRGGVATAPDASSGDRLDAAQRLLGELLADEGNPHLGTSYESARAAAASPAGAGSFAVYAAEVMRLEREFPFFELRDAARGFKGESLTIRQRLQDMQEIVNSPMVQYYHKSELAQIADEGRAVREAIDRALADAIGEVDRLSRDPATADEWNEVTDAPENASEATPAHSVNKAKEYCCRARHRARLMYLINQRFLFKQYENRCRSPHSNISDVGRAMHEYRARSNLYDHAVRHYKIDRSLTTTCNMFITMMEQYQSVFYVSSKHTHLLVCDLARLDASRHAFNLHWNVLTHSHQGGQSKSFMWSIVEEMSIEGSTFTLSYQTRRADNVDGDKNDLIRIFNEVPHSMLFGAGGGGPEDQTGPMKDVLTSCVSRVYLFDSKKYEETGARANRMAVSECIGVWFGSYNDSPAKIEDAMRSRFTSLGCERTVDPVRNTQDLMYAESLRGPGQSVVRKKTVEEKKLIQMMFFEVNKLIQIGALTEPSLEACTTVFLMVDHMLEKEGHKPASGRLFEQQCIIARTLAIYDAIDKHFFVPCAEHFGKPVTLDAFRGLDRKLVGFAHHAAMALSLSIDQLIDPMEAEVVSAIRKFHMADHRYRNSFAKKRWSNPDQRDGASADAQGGQQQQQQQQQQRAGPAHVRKDYIYGNGPATRLPDCGFVSRVEYEADYNYICFDNLSGRSKNEAIRDFAVTLSAFMDSGALGNRTKPSPQAIFDIVKGLKRRTFRCRAYRKSPDASSSGIDDVEEDPQSAEEHRSICVDDKDSVSFLCAYVNRPVETGRQMLCRVLKRILGMRHQEKKTIILGIADDATPNVLQTIEVGADDPSSPSLPDMAIPNASYMSELERVVVYGRPDGPSVDPLKMKKSIIINVDIDVWAVARRNDALFIDAHRVDPSELAPPPPTPPSPSSHALGLGVAHRRYFLGLDVTDAQRGAPAGPTPSENLDGLRRVRLEVFDGTLPDEDMGDPASYAVEPAGGGTPLPHWELLRSGPGGGPMEPYLYKLQRDHWKVTEHMESLVDYGDRHVFSYPQDVQVQGSSRQEVWDGAAAMCDGPEARYASLQSNPECFVRGLPSMAMMEPYNSYMNPAAKFISGVPLPRPAPVQTGSGGEGEGEGEGEGDFAAPSPPPVSPAPAQSVARANRSAYGKAFEQESGNARRALVSEMLHEAYGAVRAAKKILHMESAARKTSENNKGAGKGKKPAQRAMSEKRARAEARGGDLPPVKNRYTENTK